ncbi:ferredoxin [Deltaproteobacteria bacterium]|nr:ferredoxin [Deltaproteobacteria bacterium]
MTNIIRAAYFSPTGTTAKIATSIADALSLHLPFQYGEIPDTDFTLPKARNTPLSFAADELVVFGVPVYAGRVPNILLRHLDTMEGGGALAVPVVVYGNRNYDDALIELRDILEKKGLHPLAAAAFIGEHAFSDSLAAKRPDAQDLTLANAFAARVAEKIQRTTPGEIPAPLKVNGTPYPYAGYYQPKDKEGNAVDIRKVIPKIKDNCINCKICASVCPMGSIPLNDVRSYTGICIKCGACIKGCPENARYYDDPGYLYHKKELEEIYARRAQPEFFLE